MKKFSIIIYQILICFIFIGWSVVGGYPQSSGSHFKSDARYKQIEQGLSLIDNVYGIILKNYVDPVPSYNLLVGAVRGVESNVENANLLFKGTKKDVVISPITRKPFDVNISVENTRKALIEIYRYILKQYPNVSPIDLSNSLISGMLHRLDSHSSLLSSEDFKELLIDTKGKYTGIGVYMAFKDGFVTVISSIEGMSAQKAGIKSGDRIIKVNGKAIRGLSEAVKLIRGPKGTEVDITIVREGVKNSIELKAVRELIPIESVKAAVIKPGYGYIRITNFRENTTGDLIAVLDKLESGEAPMKGLILDLRDDPGGLLDQAVKVSDLFLEKGTILSIKGRKDKYNRVFRATRDQKQRHYPLVVLINGGTASGAEIVAGALKDNERALILGTSSFGKGSVQSIERLKSGYALKLTIGKYYTPSGRALQPKGIYPHIFLEYSIKDDTEKDLKNHLDMAPSGGEGNTYGPNIKRLLSDSQINRACDILERTHSNRISDMIATSKAIDSEEKNAALVLKKNLEDKKIDENLNATPMLSSKLKPRLFVLSIGVSRYKDSKLNLAFATHDAEVLAQTLKTQPNDIFREVRTKIMTDEKATRENILEAMTSFLGRAVSTDVVIIFIAGHGVKRLSTGTFYFLPYQATQSTLTTRALRWSDFQEEVKSLSKRVKNVVLILDTCHAGALQVAMRGIEVNGNLSSHFNQKGLYILASAQSDEGAFEKTEWHHGAFTYAILKGLKGSADMNANQQIDIIELFQYVEVKVADMTAGRQHPYFRMGGGSLPLFALPPQKNK